MARKKEHSGGQPHNFTPEGFNAIREHYTGGGFGIPSEKKIEKKEVGR